MTRKIALLVGVGDYGAGLKSLRCPKNGVAAMQSVLQDPEIGGFDEVISLVNPGVGKMRSRICEVFAQLTKQDLILFYFTGHGLKDMTGEFFLTTTQTQLFDNGRPNAGTAIEANFLKREIGNSLAERKVIILDCCFGAAFAGGFLAMNGDSVDLEAHLGGKGWCLLTASTSSRYALEPAKNNLSVYTRHLVEGLKTGGAAVNNQALITVRHWHEYVKQRVVAEVPAMEPAIFSGQQGYEIAIARVKIDRAKQYRRQVESKIRNGIVGPAARAILLQWQRHCQLSSAEAEEIEQAVLEAVQQTQKQILEKLSIYTKAIEAEKQLSFPLTDTSVRDLEDLQQLLDLSREFASQAEQQVLGNQLRIEPIQQRFSQPAYKPNEQRLLSFETKQVDRYGSLRSTARAQSKVYREDIGSGVKLEMVQIPQGTFAMGANTAEEGASNDEYPQRDVTLSEFWMGKHTVTQAQWQQFTSSMRSSMSSLTSRMTFDSSNLPIGGIFWTEAVEFCHWLSQRSEKNYRLPSQAQWEYACRANTTTPFYFGETITPELANYNGSYRYGQGPKGTYRQQTTEVGSFPPNAFGLYDMHGNVWEWCLDNWHDLHPDKTQGDIVRRLSGQTKVLRGGSWFYQPTDCRSANRLTYPFHNRIDDIGFRVVCTSAAKA